MSARRTSQGGYALLAVLVATTFFSLVVVALLGMMSSDVSTVSAAADTAKTRRASDGALEVAITRLKTASSAQLAQNGGCAGLEGSAVEIESLSVTVHCDPVASTEPEVASPGTGGTVLTLLGNYNGTLDDGAENDIGGVLGGLVASGAQMLNDFVASGPGLVHIGPESLKIVGDVKVRQSAIGWKSPAPSPAIDVWGSFTQGDLGALGGIEVKFFDLFPLFTTPRCGLLDETFPGDLPDLGLRLRTTASRTCAPAGGRDAVVSAAGPAVTAPATWTPAQLAAGQTLPTCASGTVVRFTPGSYNLQQTTTMNLWFRQGQLGCDNVTFWFQPGHYYFDVGGFLDGDRNALTFNDPTSNWVFGTPKGWDPATGRAPAAAFPQACDRQAQGVSITLTSRTVLKHKAGMVAVCGRTDGTGAAVPAVYQEPGPATQTWAAVPTATAPIAGTVPYANAGNMTASVPPVPASFPAWGGAFAATETAPAKMGSATCTGQCSLGVKLSGFVDAGEPAPSGDLGSAVLKIRGTATNVQEPVWWNTFTKTIVRITYGDGSGRGCTIEKPDVPRSLTVEYTIDILATCQPFPYGLVDASQLERATVEIFENLALLPAPCFLCGIPPATATIDYAWIETSTTVRPPSTMSTVVDPAGGTSLNIFGPVYLPKTQIEVSWAGSANRTPIFVGSVVARALASIAVDPTRHVGVVASRTLAPPSRRVLLRAVTGGRLRATAEVVIDDSDSTGLLQDPGRTLAVVDWKVCNRPEVATTC